MNFDITDRKIIDIVQAHFPLATEPYAEIGLKVDITEDEVIRRIRQLKTSGVIRQISPVIDSRRLGYQTTLCAVRVEPQGLECAERLISEHPAVSHGYEREHFFNLWFTLALPPESNIETELKKLASAAGAAESFALPALKVFKIGARFDLDGDGAENAGIYLSSSGELPEKLRLSKKDRAILREFQQDLPLVSMPFNEMAERLDMDVEDFLSVCRSLLKRGIIRRFGAAINHRKAGFNANAMTCWKVSSEKAAEAGVKIASWKAVSHCYERKTNSLWHYNMFAMIHGRTKDACQEVADDISRGIGLNDSELLFSTREFKKTRIKYLA